MKRKVIVVTDGDSVAQKAIEVAAQKINARTISASGGNPTPILGEQIVKLIKEAKYDPVIVMFDDKGSSKKGKGETALEFVAQHPDIQIIGALAVASNTAAEGVFCNLAITKDGELIHGSVDKTGTPNFLSKEIFGDTVEVLEKLNIPIIIGIGDIGKMDGKDDYRKGAEITTKALKYIMEKRGLGCGSN